MNVLLDIWHRSSKEERKLIIEVAEAILEEQLNILESCGKLSNGEVKMSKKYFMEMLVRPAFGDSDSHYEKLLDIIEKVEEDE